MGAVGELIRQYRRRAGLSQGELAGTDFSASYVSLIESGKRQPSEGALVLFARRLGCAVDDLRRPAVTDDTAAELELSYARLALANGEPDAARVRLDVMLERADLGLRLRHEALLLLAAAHETGGDLDAAIRILKPLYDLCLTGGSPLPITSVSIQLCWACLNAGDFDAAVRVGERALQAGDEAGLTGTEDYLKLRANLVAAYHELGDDGVALALADDLVRVSREAGSSFGEAAAYWNAALVAESRGRLHEALSMSQRALALMGEQGTSRNLTRLQYVAAWLILRADPDRAWYAATLLDRARPALEDLASPAERGYWELSRGVAHLLSGDARAAERLLRRARVHLEDVGDEGEIIQVVMSLADALVAQGRQDDGLAGYREAVELLGHFRPGWRAAALYRSLAYRLSLAGDPAGAVRCLDLALDARGIRAETVPADVAFGRREPAPAPAPAQGQGGSVTGTSVSAPGRVSAPGP